MSAALFAPLKARFPGAELLQEGGLFGAFIPKLSIETSSGAVVADVLLYPNHHSGYQSRLFVERQLEGPQARNWTPHAVAGRAWWACSWQGVDSNLPWLEVLANHLRAFR